MLSRMRDRTGPSAFLRMWQDPGGLHVGESTVRVQAKPDLASFVVVPALCYDNPLVYNCNKIYIVVS